MTTYSDLVEQLLAGVDEVYPWDLAEWLLAGREVLVIDVREPDEFEAMHIPGSVNVPRGILEAASEYGYEETVPDLADAREREVVLVCRSGNRSVLAAHVLGLLGFGRVWSLKTGVRGWNDYEQPLEDASGRPVPLEAADQYFTTRLRDDQLPRAARPPS
jgi:rhodanese-related sulfurtransferase